MKQKMRSAMIILIAIQSAIEIAKFLKKSYEWLTTPQPPAEEVDETKPQTPPANDPIVSDNTLYLKSMFSLNRYGRFVVDGEPAIITLHGAYSTLSFLSPSHSTSRPQTSATSLDGSTSRASPHPKAASSEARRFGSA